MSQSKPDLEAGHVNRPGDPSAGLSAVRDRLGPLDREAQRRVARAVTSGEAVSDPDEAAAAVALARSAERRLHARIVPNALMVSAGTTLVWLVLVALPAMLGSGMHPGVLVAGLGIGILLFAMVVLLGQRQVRLVRRSARRNHYLLNQHPGAAPAGAPQPRRERRC